MNNLFSIVSSKWIYTLLFLLLIAKAIGVGLLWILPENSVELKHTAMEASKGFIKMDFSVLFQKPKNGYLLQNKTTNKSSYEMHDFILFGLYGTQRSGYAILALQKSPTKSKIIAVGESFKGYKLKKIFLDYVVLERNKQEYIVRIAKQKIQKSWQTQEQHRKSVIQKIQKHDIHYFMRHPRQIWKNIAITEHRENGNINGFVITWVKPHSKFAALGLKKGDILIRVNDKWLRSYKDAFDAYSQVKDVKKVFLTILRNNQEKEFVYEIY